MTHQDLIPHLFRTEYGKIATVLCKVFGIQHIEIAEDIASETFLAALENWTYKSIPENPTAWLYTVAKNKAKNYMHRNQVYTQKIVQQITRDSPVTDELEIDLSDKNISDAQLQMLFAVCHPSIPTEAQVGLALRILCGFSIDEIANAFLTNKDTINKRLFRAKEKLRAEKVEIEFPGQQEIGSRLEAVLTTLYLLFNEGYYSESDDSIVREDLCLEAMRLLNLLIENEQTNLPKVNALMALMCFHASRFEARKDKAGQMILYRDQDERLWDQQLITKGIYFLHQSAQGQQLSKYHLEANIAYWHTVKDDVKEKWENILYLHNQLLITAYSPIAALNRTYALSKVKGNREAIAEAEKLRLTGNHFYHVLLGELYKDIDRDKARQHFEAALSLAATNTDRQTIRARIASL
ncbi:MAG TPA: sigma-70 family RNA polymerase sigma factor [Chitinophagaceae bacterium]|nr:sigma-70 family RNA polymerase sigma factor [Chitinophagaceae bacterium]